MTRIDTMELMREGRRRGLLALLMLGACLLVQACSVIAQAQQEAVSAVWEVAQASESAWTVGDVTPLQLLVTHPADVSVSLPELPASWGSFEVSTQEVAEQTGASDGRAISRLAASVILWAPGEYETPPIKVILREPDGSLREASVQPLRLVIESVLTEEQSEKRDLKPQASLPRPPIWPWVVAGLAAAGLAFFAARRLARRLRGRSLDGAASAVPVDDRLPEEIAYEELERIEALDLPSRREFKRHYTLVADCVRVYVEGLYKVPAMDRTTGEVMTALRKVSPDISAAGLLRALLEEADLVKFAKLVPSVQSARSTVGEARRFVDTTRPSREEVESSAPGRATGG